MPKLKYLPNGRLLDEKVISIDEKANGSWRFCVFWGSPTFIFADFGPFPNDGRVA